MDEILGFRDGLLETGKYINLEDYNTLDIVGTGGDGKNSFNISTCSCFVVAGAGYKVTKHGNGSSSSVSGASNVLQLHGVKFTDDEKPFAKALIREQYSRQLEQNSKRVISTLSELLTSASEQMAAQQALDAAQAALKKDKAEKKANRKPTTEG